MSLAHLWTLNPAVTFLNHGSYGACPRAVLEKQAELRTRLERQPVQFLGRDAEPMLAAARETVGEFLGVPGRDIGFVHNATGGVNTVLRSLRFEPGDELLVTDHAYNACANALERAAEADGAKVVVVHIPIPIRSEEDVMNAVMHRVTPRTKLALLDHVTSPTALVFPIARLVRELQGRGIDCLIDGAHAPGMVDLDLAELGAAYYTGNGHKWLCSPKGAAFLYVRPDRQERIRPLTISHGANADLRGRTRFEAEFSWTGTQDPSAWICLAESVRYMESLLPGGWTEVRQRNQALVFEARRLLNAALDAEPLCPESMLGSIASLALPGRGVDDRDPTKWADPLQSELLVEFGIEVPIFRWGEPPQRLLRISAQLYNSLDQYERLAEALVAKGLGR
jgi:isopenicillin-N epimerase